MKLKHQESICIEMNSNSLINGITGCQAAEPSDDIKLHGKLTHQEKSLADCAYRCYSWNWNDLKCNYYKEPGCAGFDWWVLSLFATQ